MGEHHHHTHHHHDHDAHSHDHHHHHHFDIKDVSWRLILGTVINLAFVGIEAAAGWYYGSIALLSDAGHNLSDAASLLLALLAFRMSSIAASKYYTFGYQKSTILAALFNAGLLLVAMVVLGYESIERIWQPQEVLGSSMAIVAGIGIVINSATAYLFLHNKEDDINLKSAYLHMVADALVSLGVVISGIVIYYTNWFWVDSVVSLVVIAMLVVSSWRLFVESWRLAIDGVPHDIDLDEVRHSLQHVAGILEVHELHVWALSSSKNAAILHIVADEHAAWDEVERIKREARHALEHHDIKEVTIEIERAPCHH